MRRRLENEKGLLPALRLDPTEWARDRVGVRCLRSERLDCAAQGDAGQIASEFTALKSGDEGPPQPSRVQNRPRFRQGWHADWQGSNLGAVLMVAAGVHAQLVGPEQPRAG
jgi:hypothetical protein